MCEVAWLSDLVEVRAAEGRHAPLLALTPSSRRLPSGPQRAEGAPADRGEPRWTGTRTHKRSRTHTLAHTLTQSLTCHMLSHLHRHQAACNPGALPGIQTHTHTYSIHTYTRKHSQTVTHKGYTNVRLHTHTAEVCSQCVIGDEDHCCLSCLLQRAPVFVAATHTFTHNITLFT